MRLGEICKIAIQNQHHLKQPENSSHGYTGIELYGIGFLQTSFLPLRSIFLSWNSPCSFQSLHQMPSVVSRPPPVTWSCSSLHTYPSLTPHLYLVLSLSPCIYKLATFSLRLFKMSHFEYFSLILVVLSSPEMPHSDTLHYDSAN